LETKRDPVSKHIAGIIPVANMETDIDMLLPLCLAPISNGFTLLQRSILECAYAGCKTIWIVCSDVDGPLIKKVCGDYITDPHSLDDAKFKKYPSENIKQIPLFYVPISYKNSEKRGLGVAAIEGIISSFAVSSRMSRWLVPNRYYISSPYGVYNPSKLAKERLTVKKVGSLLLTCESGTVLDGRHLGLSIDTETFKHCNYLFKKTSHKEDFTLDKIFNNGMIIKDMTLLEIANYKEVTSWAGYENIFSEGLGFEIYPTWRNLFDSNYKNKKG